MHRRRGRGRAIRQGFGLSKRLVGLLLIAAGGVMVAVGLIGWATAGTTQQAVGTSTTVGAPVTSTSETTTSMPSATTTTPPVTTSTAPPTTTTTIDTDAAIEAFIELFTDAIATEDIDLLFETLHPAVVSLFDETTCRDFITEEIVQLREYRLIGEIDGPTAQSVAGVTVEMYRGPVAFTFQGEDFTSEAAFAFEGPEVRWFTQCGE